MRFASSILKPSATHWLVSTMVYFYSFISVGQDARYDFNVDTNSMKLVPLKTFQLPREKMRDFPTESADDLFADGLNWDSMDWDAFDVENNISFQQQQSNDPKKEVIMDRKPSVDLKLGNVSCNHACKDKQR